MRPIVLVRIPPQLFVVEVRIVLQHTGVEGPEDMHAGYNGSEFDIVLVGLGVCEGGRILRRGNG